MLDTNRLSQMKSEGLRPYARKYFSDVFAQSEDSTSQYHHGSKPDWQIVSKISPCRNCPKRPESLCHIDAQPSEQRLYTRIPELSHRQGTNWREVSLCIWSLSWFGRNLLLHEGSLHKKVVFYLAMFCFTLWFDRIPCVFHWFALLFLMSFLCFVV